MIIKSMSRKEPSFGQLTAYMSDEKSDRSFDLHHNLFSRDPSDIAAEFEANARHLGRRRGGNYLFHEILSIDTRECGQDREVKEKLRLLALEFIERRCPRSMVYGALHRDHEEHLHYHLMISANERGEPKRQRLTPSQFNAKKREMERFARETYPELKQDRVMDISNAERDERRQTRKSRKEKEMEKRGAKLSQKEKLAQELRSILAYAHSQAEFERMLHDKGFTFYERGKNFCIRPLAKDGDGQRSRPHRFSTLGIHEDYEGFLERVEPLVENERGAGEKEKEARAERVRGDTDSDNETYVKYDSNANLKSEHGSQQTPETSQERDPQDGALKREPEPSTEGKEVEMNRDNKDGLKKPSPERQELIDKGHVQPDPERDLMSHEDWKAQDKFTAKVQQSWRRTMDDFRGRTKDLKDRARGKGDDDGEQER